MRPIDADKIEYYDDEQGFEIAYKLDIDKLPTLTPQNEPLTLDELLTMDGEPVYVVYRPDISGEKPQFWALVEVDKQRVWLADKDRWAFDYKKLSADIEAIYRRPPERQEDT